MRRHGYKAKVRRVLALRRALVVEKLMQDTSLLRTLAAAPCICGEQRRCRACVARRYLILVVRPRVGDVRPVAPRRKEKTR